MPKNDIHARVLKTLIAQGCYCQPPEGIKPEHKLYADLMCDSLDIIEIMMALEEEFGIRIDDDEFMKLATVQQVIDHINGVCVPEAA